MYTKSLQHCGNKMTVLCIIDISTMREFYEDSKFYIPLLLNFYNLYLLIGTVKIFIQFFNYLYHFHY